MISILLFFFILSNALYAQFICPFNIENCQGSCGRFIDLNSDGYCDYTTITPHYFPAQNDSIPEQKQQKLKKNTKNTTDNKEHMLNNSTKQNSYIFSFKQISRKKAPKAKIINKRNSYRLILWTTLAFSLYFLSTISTKLKLYDKKTHKQIWNTLLLFTFFVSAILGLILVIQVNYGILLSWYRDFLRWHVEFGIAMAWIGIFHALWHYSYYKNIFLNKHKNNN